MRPLYQPLAALLAAGVCAACGAESDVALPPPPPKSWPLAVFLASRSYHPLSVDAQGGVVAAELDVESARGVRLRPGSPAEPLIPAASGDSLPLALLPGGEVLVAAAAADRPPRLALLEGGRLRELGEPGERLLGIAPGGRGVWSARTGAAGDDWIETSLPRLGRHVVLAAPAGFALAAVSPSGRRAAARRELHDEADEVVLVDRTSGERRLLLPTGHDGRFVPLLFDADERRLLLTADDESDLPRLEWLELATGAREVALETPCAALGARLHGERLLAELACSGRRELALVAPDGDRLAADWAARLTAGLRAVAALPDAGDVWWLAVAGPAAARDLLRLPAHGPPEPASWGLTARLDPVALPHPRAASGEPERGAPPYELWPAHGTPVGGLVWLEADDRPPAWGEFDPFLAHLALHGVTVLRLRARGSDGFGRALRLAGDGDPWLAALADIEAAARRLVAEPGLAGRPLALVGEGALAGAAAVAAAAREPSPFAAVVAFDPAADPLAVLDTIATTPEPARTRLVARWGDPADPRTRERRQAATSAAGSARVPLLVVLDGAAADATARSEELAAATASGRPLRVVVRRRPLLVPGPGRSALEEGWRFLSTTLAGWD